MANSPIYANNVAGVLAGSIGPSDTALLLSAGQGARFPSPTSGDYFYLTVVHAVTAAVEIMKCTSRSVDTLTVERGRDGTTAISFDPGAVVEMRMTAIMLRELDWRAARGVASGVASLDSTTRIPVAQMPTSVPIKDGSGKILVTDLPTTVAYDADVAQKVTKAGDTMTGKLEIEVASGRQFAAAWGDISSIGNGKALFANNAYLNAADNTLRVARTHASFGYSGILFPGFGASPQIFSVPGANVTQDLVVNPTMYDIWHEGNFSPSTKLNTSGGTISGALTVTGALTTSTQNAIIIGRNTAGANLILTGGNATMYFRPVSSGSATGQMSLNTAGLLSVVDVAASASDKHFKTKVRKLAPREHLGDVLDYSSWIWTRRGPVGQRGQGLIAQQVQEHAPEHVHVGEDGYLGIDKASLSLEIGLGNSARIRKLEKILCSTKTRSKTASRSSNVSHSTARKSPRSSKSATR